MKQTLRIGTRGSALAMTQARWVHDALQRELPKLTLEIVEIKTRGDRVQDRPLHQIGGTGLFTREIERALLDGEVDLAVHSLKDLPAQMREGLALAAVPHREDPRDAWICPAGHDLDGLPDGATVATGALRRQVQLLRLRPDLRLTGMRGNLDTRLRKVGEDDTVDATLVAAAGLSRMGWLGRATRMLDVEQFVPAGGQGALGLQVREDDTVTGNRVRGLTHPPTERETAGERAFLAALGAGCQVPVAVHGRVRGAHLSLDGLISSLDAGTFLRSQVEGPVSRAEELGERLATRLLDRGGREVLAALEESE